VDPLRPLRAFDRVQQRHPPLAIPIAVLKKFGDDQAGSLAALIAYYAFFSLFPLLLVFVTVLGFVFHGNTSVQKAISDSVLGHFPVIGTDLQDKHLTGRTVSLVIGIVFALWAGLGVTQAAQNAFNKVWAVPFKQRPDFFLGRVRGLMLVTVLGAVFVISTVISGLIGGGLSGPLLTVFGIVFSLILNFVLFAAAFRALTSLSIPTSSMWIGAVIGGILWEILQLAGGVYVNRVISRATSTYGFFATVIGLLAWLHLGAQATLYAAEINVVVVRKLWPRSLFGPRTPAGERTLAALAKIEERSDEQEVDVHFHPTQEERPSPEPKP
jgi:membrane protein